MAHENTYGQGEGTLTRAAALVAEAKVDFDRLAGTLESNIANLHGKWGGSGSRAFQILQEAWQEKQRMIVGALNEFENSLQVTERTNVATDEQQGDYYTRTASRLGDVSTSV
ncbi:WXG100 family type VII secretion target [Nocardioides sp. SYSU D00038]|uniref:WXG100 family type VII secretion target n=1 Tax=Nocardioides sp. SYSU D00038 TaxID=2812554 RepID=UPI0019682D48|nr:WXG100 family type VII secretion target [Nocardioides sp. SYSU D00038]